MGVLPDYKKDKNMAVVTSSGQMDIGSIGRLPTKEGGKIRLGNPKKEPVIGDSGVLGHTEKFETAPGFNTTLVNTNALDKKKLMAMTDDTITYRLNSGEVYLLTDPFIVNELELDVANGTMEVEFAGTKCIEQ